MWPTVDGCEPAKSWTSTSFDLLPWPRNKFLKVWAASSISSWDCWARFMIFVRISEHPPKQEENGYWSNRSIMVPNHGWHSTVLPNWPMWSLSLINTIRKYFWHLESMGINWSDNTSSKSANGLAMPGSTFWSPPNLQQLLAHPQNPPTTGLSASAAAMV